MGPDTTTATPYDAGIADVEARIRNMQVALDTLMHLRASYLGEPAPAASSVSRPPESQVQHDSFFGMTIADAAIKYLNMMKATKSTAEIAAALEQGGLKHSSSNFPNNVRAIIGQRDEFLRVPNGNWGLSEWYPGRGKKTAKSEKPAKVAKAKRTARQAKPRATGSATLEARILEHMKTDPNREWVGSEISTALGAQRESVQSTLSRMAKDAKAVTKSEKGYRIVRLGIAA